MKDLSTFGLNRNSMKNRSKFTSVSVVYALCIFFAVSRFLYFDAEKLLPHAGVDYSHLAQWTNASVPDSLLSQIPQEASLPQQSGLSKPASVAAAPFFWAALKVSGKSEFSPTMLVMLELLALCLLMISLWWLRKFFRNFFDDAYSIFFILVIALATPVYLSFALNGLSSDLFEFASISGALYFISVWHKEPASRNAVKLVSTITVSVFLTPVACFLIPFALLFDSNTIQHQPVLSPLAVLKTRINKLFQGNKVLLATFVLIPTCGLISGLYLLTGFSFVDSVEGVTDNLELFPQLVLSYRKGLWLYAPFATLAMFSLPVYFSKSKASALAVLLSIVTAFLVVLLIGSWWGNNALAIPELNGIFILLVFPAYALISKCKEQGEIASVILSLFFLGCLVYTQFFAWQIGSGILKPEKLSKRYFYSALFSLKEPDDSSLSRILGRGLMPADKLNYVAQEVFKTDFTGGNEFTILDLNNPYHRINADAEYALNRKFPFNPDQYRKDALLEIRFRYRMSSGLCNAGPFAVLDVESSAERYGYQNFFMESDASADWLAFSAIYKLPEIKYPGDLLNFYIWNNGKCFIDVDDVQLTLFEPKEKHTNKEVFLVD